MAGFTVSAGQQSATTRVLTGSETGIVENGASLTSASSTAPIMVNNAVGVVISNAGSIIATGTSSAISVAASVPYGNLTIINTGTISTSDPSLGSYGIYAFAPTSLILDNSGTISSGPFQSSAVQFGSLDDTLIIRNGSNIVGLVNGGIGGSDTLDYRFWTGSGVIVNLGSSGPGFGSNLNFENTIGSAQADRLTGWDEANLLVGAGGDDVLVGLAGDDTLRGGVGNDSLDGGPGIDVADYSDQTTDITVSLAITVGQITGTGTDTLVNFENFTGGSGNDRLTGDGNANVLIGGAGNDTLNGGGGVDTADYSRSTARVTANLATGVATDGFGGIDSLSGISRLIGGAGDDLLSGDGNASVLDGGAGIDIADYSGNTSLQALVINMATNTIGNGRGGTDTLISIEGVTGGAGDDRVTGNSNANVLSGGAGNDTLRGGGGSDTLDGGSGVDTADYSNGTTDLFANLAGGTILDGLNAGTVRLANIENVLGGLGSDQIIGDSNANVLTGGAGSDVLAGGAGNDTLDGGGGDDTADYSSETAAIAANLATGVATDGTGAIDTLLSIDNLSGGAANDLLIGNGNANWLEGNGGDDTLVGNAGDDVLLGNAGDDTLVGGVGTDQLRGGTGTDTADYSTNTSAQAIVAFLGDVFWQVVDGFGGTDLLIDVENVAGGAGNDRLTGNGNANVLIGNNGNDTLVGGTGNDTLSGGGDVDTADYSSGTANLTANLATGTATDGLGGIDTLLGIDNLIGGAAHDLLTGDGNGNVLDGGAGNDTLVGGVGSDTLIGGTGIDLADYSGNTSAQAIVANLAAGTIVDGLSGGTDTVSTTENVTGGAGNDRLTGDGNANVLTGGNGNDTLVGGSGNDTLNGGGNVDTADYSSGIGNLIANLVTGVATDGLGGTDVLIGIDNLIGGAGNDSLTGNASDNLIDGRAGNDAIDGGAGTDLARLSGTQGSYRFGVRDEVVITSGADGLDQFVNVENFQWGNAAAVNIASLQSAPANNGLVFAKLGAASAGYILPDAYTGPVQGLVNQQLGGSGNDIILGTVLSDFLNGGAGDDALDGGAGNDVIDGGLGSNFLTGGAGVDTFFVDGRGAATANTWSTITDYAAGEQVTIFGYKPGVSGFIWVEGDGAAGYQGATMHWDLDGDGLVDTSVTFSGLTQAQLPVQSFGTVGGQDYVFFG